MTDTLGNLRAELRRVLGFGAVADSSGPTQALLNGFLQRAQQLLYWEYDWDELERYFSFQTVAGTQDYNHPDDGAGRGYDPRKIKSVHVVDSASVWRPLSEGVPGHLYTQTTRNIPYRYERLGGQMRLWPVPDQVYTVQILAPYALASFSADTDTTTIDSELVFLLAAANAKRHYRQDDAQAYQDQLGIMLSRLRAANHGRHRYIPGDRQDERIPPIPRLVP